MIVGRRLAAIIVGLTLLQPSAALAEAVCDVHGSAPLERTAPHAHAQASHDETVAAQESCHDVPPQTDCCRLLASCGTELGVAMVRTGLLPAGKSLRVIVDVSRPLSYLAAPEPPPPRA